MILSANIDVMKTYRRFSNSTTLQLLLVGILNLSGETIVAGLEVPNF